MEEIIITMKFEADKPLTPRQKAILRELVDDYQYEIGQSVGMTETEWSMEGKPYES